jgi:hypothetical protein
MRSAAPTRGAISAPPLAPTNEAIDREHLARMTFGEPSLEREVLALFDRQAGMLLARMVPGELPLAATAAHTLKGSARGVGAWRVALAAEAVEFADAKSFDGAVRALTAAIDDTSAAIAQLLRGH